MRISIDEFGYDQLCALFSSVNQLPLSLIKEGIIKGQHSSAQTDQNVGRRRKEQKTEERNLDQHHGKSLTVNSFNSSSRIDPEKGKKHKRFIIFRGCKSKFFFLLESLREENECIVW